VQKQQRAKEGLEGGVISGMGQADISPISEGEEGYGGEKGATGKHQADLPA